MNRQTECFVDHLLNSSDACEALEDWILDVSAGLDVGSIRFMAHLTSELLEFNLGIDMEEAANTFRLRQQPPEPEPEPDSPARIGLWPES